MQFSKIRLADSRGHRLNLRRLELFLCHQSASDQQVISERFPFLSSHAKLSQKQVKTYCNCSYSLDVHVSFLLDTVRHRWHAQQKQTASHCRRNKLLHWVCAVESPAQYRGECRTCRYFLCFYYVICIHLHSVLPQCRHVLLSWTVWL